MKDVNIKTKEEFLEEFKNYKKELIAKKVFNTSLKDIDEAIKWYEGILNKFFKDNNVKSKLVLVFQELFMNAYEHGNLGISKKEKARLLKEDFYIDFLKDKEKECDKKIIVKIYKLINSILHLAVEICDEGEGFDFDKIGNTKTTEFNGRGILISNKITKIYYNRKGNCALFINNLI